MGPFQRKQPILEEEGKLERHMSLFDLCLLSVAGTVGSGVFALIGQVAHIYAGPASCYSFILAGVACTLSGFSFAELSSHFPAEGGAYAYVYATLGEGPAFLAGWLLTLEFGVSGAAVARVWNDKLVVWLVRIGLMSDHTAAMTAYHPLCPLAALLQAFCAYILYRGVRVGKSVTTVMTALKCALIAFMILGALVLFKPENMEPFAPNGVAGVLQGGVVSFFGYLGFDEVCVMAGEAKNPIRDVPLSIFISLTLITCIHVVAAVAMVGMIPFQSMNPSSSFAVGFFDRGFPIWGQIVAVGELTSLPVVVLVCFTAQPRIFFAMAKDGLLPAWLGHLKDGNLENGIIFSGVLLTLIALTVPFASLDDMISAGVLLVFIIINAAVIVLRRGSSALCVSLLVCINVLCLTGGFAVANGIQYLYLVLVSYVGVVSCSIALHLLCPEEKVAHPLSGNSYLFRQPFFPLFPVLGKVVNWALFAQLSISGLRDTALSLLIVLATYCFFAAARWHKTYKDSAGDPAAAAGFLTSVGSVTAYGAP
jgi:amino acid transporter